MIGFIVLILLISVFLAWSWVNEIDHMKENHPNYKGEDFLNWDENENHTENNF